MALPAFQQLEKQIGKQIRLFEKKRGALEKRLERQFRLFETKFDAKKEAIEKKLGIRIDDELRFIRTWLENPLKVGAVTPSGKILARTMARYVDPNSEGPIVELGPGTGPVTDALIKNGVDPSR